MSDEGGLTPVQIDALRKLLERARMEVETSLVAANAEARPVDLSLSIGRLSRVDAIQQQQMAVARRERLEIQLQQIRAAFGRMDFGSYGPCIKCGEPIGFERLQARPESPFCRDCQSGRSPQ